MYFISKDAGLSAFSPYTFIIYRHLHILRQQSGFLTNHNIM